MFIIIFGITRSFSFFSPSTFQSLALSPTTHPCVPPPPPPPPPFPLPPSLFVLSLSLLPGYEVEQQGSSHTHSGGDSEPDVGGCPALHGPHELYPHVVVSSTSDCGIPHLPLPGHGLGRVCRIRCHDTHDPTQHGHRICEQEISGRCVCVGGGGGRVSTRQTGGYKIRWGHTMSHVEGVQDEQEDTRVRRGGQGH